jgi:hypothetical protein
MRARHWKAVAWLLVLGGLLRAFLLVSHEPLAGYANQYDMIRTSACIGYYADLPAQARYQASPAAPLVRYRHADGPRDACYGSSEVLLAAIAGVISRASNSDPESMSLRTVGLVKLAFLALAVLAVSALLHRHAAAAIYHGLIVFFVVTDPVVTLWMNTLYTEFAALVGLYLALTAFTGHALDHPRWPATALLATGLACIAFSREQFALLPPILAAGALPWLWPRSRAIASGILVFAVACTALAFAVLPRPPGLSDANRVDAYLGLIIPSSADPRRTLRRLGLPERCERMAGATWYLRRGEDLDVACPEVLSLRSTAFLALVASEPDTLVRALVRVLPMMQAISPSYVGMLAGREQARIEDLPPFLASPLAAAFPAMPSWLFEALVCASIVAAAGCLVLGTAASLRRQRSPPPRLLAGALLGLVVGYAWATTALGDGGSEAARHFLPGALAVVGFIAGVPFAVVAQRGLGGIATTCVTATIAVAACVALHHWSSRQPRASGVVDDPPVVRGDLQLHGWALDPLGIRRIEVWINEVRLDAAYGAAPTEALRDLYPGYVDGHHGRFALFVPAARLLEWGACGDVALRVDAVNRAEIRTEIDRRRISLEACPVRSPRT